MHFDETPAADRFRSQAEERATALAVLDTIAVFASSFEEADEIWRTCLLPGCDAETTAEQIYCVVNRNFAVPATALLWHGDAGWALTARERLLRGVPRARWPGR